MQPATAMRPRLNSIAIPYNKANMLQKKNYGAFSTFSIKEENEASFTDSSDSNSKLKSNVTLQ